MGENPTLNHILFFSQYSIIFEIYLVFSFDFFSVLSHPQISFSVYDNPIESATSAFINSRFSNLFL